MKAEVCNGSDGPSLPVLSFQFIQLNWEEQDLLKKQQGVCSLAQFLLGGGHTRRKKRKDAEFGCQVASLN